MGSEIRGDQINSYLKLFMLAFLIPLCLFIYNFLLLKYTYTYFWRTIGGGGQLTGEVVFCAVIFQGSPLIDQPIAFVSHTFNEPI